MATAAGRREQRDIENQRANTPPPGCCGRRASSNNAQNGPTNFHGKTIAQMRTDITNWDLPPEAREGLARWSCGQVAAVVVLVAGAAAMGFSSVVPETVENAANIKWGCLGVGAVAFGGGTAGFLYEANKGFRVLNQANAVVEALRTKGFLELDALEVLHQQVEQEQRNLEEQRAQLGHLKQSIQTMTDQVAGLREVKQGLEQSLEDQKTLNAQEKAEAERRLGVVKAQIATAQSTIDHLETLKQQTEASVERYKTQLSQLATDIDAAQEKLEKGLAEEIAEAKEKSLAAIKEMQEKAIADAQKEAQALRKKAFDGIMEERQVFEAGKQEDLDDIEKQRKQLGEKKEALERVIGKFEGGSGDQALVTELRDALQKIKIE